jgi:hypothetical protein
MRLLASLALPLLACTTLGPTPALTGLSADPARRTSLELGVAAVPGYYLSESTTDTSAGAALPQTMVAVEVGRRVPGLVVAGRVVGDGGDKQVEPIVGYRTALGGSPYLSVGGFVSGTHASASAGDASYRLTRLAAEATFDAQVSADHRWLEVHLFGTVAATYLDATGTYCIGESGHGIDCDPGIPRVDAELAGIFTAAGGGVALDILRRPHSWFHGVRIAVHYAVGAMPRIVAGETDGGSLYGAGGASLSIAFGGRD